tara:strand:+ start:4575 stop:5369 length:795 start_codon:yes stop_codon:yes gene_type:complete
MFSRQAPIINQNLWQGGVDSPQASTLANAFGQCRAEIVHRGPITIDYTSPDMGLIDGPTVEIKYPELILQPPEELPPISGIPEEQPPPNNNNPLPGEQPIQPNPGGGGDNINNDSDPNGSIDELSEYSEGDYIEFKDEQDETESINLHHDDARRHCIFLKDNTPEIVGSVDFKATNAFQENDWPEDQPCATLEISETDTKTDFILTANKPEWTYWVQDIWLDDEGKIVIQKTGGYVFKPTSLGPDYDSLATDDCPDPNGGGSGA